MAGIQEIVLMLLWYLLVCNLSRGWTYPFRNTSLSWDERVSDLVYRLSLNEIIAQMTSAAVVQSPPAISRLGIEPYLWDNDCLRSYTRHNATAFPDALGLAASFRYIGFALLQM